MNPSVIPDKNIVATTKTRKLPRLAVIGSILLVFVVIGVFIFRLPKASTLDQNVPHAQLYVSVDDNTPAAIKHRLIVLDGRDGSVRWSHADVGAESVPSILHDTVAFDDPKGTLQMLNVVDGSTRWSWQGTINGADNAHIYANVANPLNAATIMIAALSVQTGHEEWRITVAKGDKLIIDDNVPYILENTTDGKQYLEQLNLQTGTVVWRTKAPVVLSGVIAGTFDDMIYANSDTTLYAIDVSSGTMRWEMPYKSGQAYVQTLFSCNHKTVCLGYSDGSVAAIADESGQSQWHYTFKHTLPPGGFFSPLAFADDNDFIVIHAPQNIAVIHKSDGSLVWEKSFSVSTPISLSAPYPLGNGMLYVIAQAGGAKTTILAFAVATGQMLWQAPGGYELFGSPVLIGNIVAIAKTTVVTALDAKTGKELWSKENKIISNQNANGTVEYLSGSFVPAQ